MKRFLTHIFASLTLAALAALAIPTTATAEDAPGTSGSELTSHAASSLGDSGSSPALGIWVGAGALVLTAGAVAVGATVRRHRHDLES